MRRLVSLLRRSFISAAHAAVTLDVRDFVAK